MCRHRRRWRGLKLRSTSHPELLKCSDDCLAFVVKLTEAPFQRRDLHLQVVFCDHWRNNFHHLAPQKTRAFGQGHDGRIWTVCSYHLAHHTFNEGTATSPAQRHQNSSRPGLFALDLRDEESGTVVSRAGCSLVMRPGTVPVRGSGW